MAPHTLPKLPLTQAQRRSWMEYIASNGYDVYLLDRTRLRTVHATRANGSPAERNPPFATTEDAVRDVAAVVEFIRKRRGVDSINLIGWSWGTRIMQWYTGLTATRSTSLFSTRRGGYARLHHWYRPARAIGAYRTVRMDQAKARWLTGVANERKAD